MSTPSCFRSLTELRLRAATELIVAVRFGFFGCAFFGRAFSGRGEPVLPCGPLSSVQLGGTTGAVIDVARPEGQIAARRYGKGLPQEMRGSRESFSGTDMIAGVAGMSRGMQGPRPRPHPPHDASGRTDMPRWTRATGLSLLCAATVFPAAACTTSHPDARQAAQPRHSSSARPATATSAPSTAHPSAQTPPELDVSETLAGRQESTSGNASVAYSRGRKGQTLIIAVRCQGEGKIKVAVRPVNVSFSQPCVADESSTNFNEVDLTGADRDGVASVEAPSAVRWSMTIGHGAPVQEEPPEEG
ncbi:hypothetical protein [Streptomyces griseorubiginosus]|uniref:hypothetical protein n=1 Tax=Streptomyces griseorubiginosus TaxID=67304 RepID=UPI0036656063